MFSAASKRVYGTQLSYIAMSKPTNLTWKLHHPSRTDALTGDLTMDIQRHVTSPTPSASYTPTASDASSSSTTTPASTSQTSTSFFMSANTSSPPFSNPAASSARPGFAKTNSFNQLKVLATSLTSASMGTDFSSSSDDPTSSNWVPSVTNQSSACQAASEAAQAATQRLLSKKSSRFQLPSDMNVPATPADSSSISSATDTTTPAISNPTTKTNAWYVTLPEPVEMSPSEAPYVAKSESISSGRSDDVDVHNLRVATLPVGLVNLRFLRIACSMFGAIAIAEDGSLHYWTLDADQDKYTEGGPVPRFVGNTIVDIAAGHDHYLAVTIDGDLYAWGANQFNQCSGGHHAHVYAPFLVLSKRILACSAGAHSSLAIDTHGGVTTWGRGQMSVTIPVQPSATTPASVPAPKDPSLSDDEEGEDDTLSKGAHLPHRARSQPTHRTIAVDCLAHSPEAAASRADPLRVSVPTIVSFPNNAQILQASLSASMGVAVARDGSVFAWGDANAICAASAEVFSTAPVRIPFPKDVRIVRALAGDFHALALDANGGLWTWGNRFIGGRLVHNAPSTAEPIKADIGNDVVMDFGISQKHSAALTASGFIWIWKAFGKPVPATPLSSRAPIGISHGTSSASMWFPLGGPRDGEPPVDFSQSSSTLYDAPYDEDITDIESDSAVDDESS